MGEAVLALMVWVRRHGLLVIEVAAAILAFGGLAAGALTVSTFGFLVLGFAVPWHVGTVVRRRFARR